MATAVLERGRFERVLTPAEAAPAQSEAIGYWTNKVPASAVAQLAGAAPVKILMMPEVPTVVSIASRRAAR